MIYFNLLIIVLLIITIHEFGHYAAARFFKAEVTDFSIGFGKAIYKFTDKNKTNWKLSILPLGGYVKIKGLDTIFQEKNANNFNQIGTFQSLALYKKIIILFAGSFFNILSVFLFLFLFSFFSGYKIYSNEIGFVQENSSAEINDIRIGDRIISINNINTKNFNDIVNSLQTNKNIFLEIERENIIIQKKVELKYSDKYNKYLLGITNSDNFTIIKYDIKYSFKNSFIFIPIFYSQFFSSIKKSYKDETLGKELAGPIGIVKNADKLMLDKFSGIFNMFILFSLSISILNLLPIPLLDGGHIIYFIIRDVFSDALPHIITKLYIVTGLTLISFLFFIVTFNDIFYK